MITLLSSMGCSQRAATGSHYYRLNFHGMLLKSRYGNPGLAGEVRWDALKGMLSKSRYGNPGLPCQTPISLTPKPNG
ncbi:MAG: hypothetical protein F6J98_09645 [Moorea sp. SIO4G2]|uniref:hypothetical protein n=1 Tax=Moorena sp. SIO3F7 TaxID=2607839 RepID=UPI0013FB7582|nr:hypothetical protein [Moorena sp. SIO3F7]NEO13703.1 hypothetical protein [Moorena sp. SIO3E8]NEO60675.1 hypothetical protein [Moorena sp. SIO4G2]NEP98369.1 hypothetical protein [Moorena sp. SIO3F7]